MAFEWHVASEIDTIESFVKMWISDAGILVRLEALRHHVSLGLCLRSVNLRCCIFWFIVHTFLQSIGLTLMSQSCWSNKSAVFLKTFYPRKIINVSYS